jgi:hypothetical protein
MKLGCLVVAVVLLSACAYKNPTTPTTTIQPRAGVPSRIELTANPGVGAEGGTGAISARVFDGLSTALAEQTVTFTASEGTLGAAHVLTDDKGVARTNITGPEGATVSIVAAVGTVEQKTLIALQTRPGGAPPITPPVFPPPSPPPPPGTPAYSVTLAASPSSVAVGGSSTLTATVEQLENAPAPTSYRWDCNGDAVPDFTTTVPTQTCTFPVFGSILTSVQVVGGTVSAVATAAVRVLLPRYEVALSTTPPGPVAGNPITLNAAVTLLDGAPAPTSYDWDCTSNGVVDGNTAVNSFAGCVFPSAGTALVSVVVTGAGLTKSATLVVTVAPPPVPVITISCSAPATTPPTTCAASATVGGVLVPSSRITRVDWDWGDHTTSTTFTNVSTHPYAAGLTYELNAIVTVSGNPATGTGHVTVKP